MIRLRQRERIESLGAQQAPQSQQKEDHVPNPTIITLQLRFPENITKDVSRGCPSNCTGGIPPATPVLCSMAYVAAMTPELNNINEKNLV